MRTINTELITQQVKEMCMDVNIHLSKDVKCAIEEAEKKEESPLGKQILGQLEEKYFSELNAGPGAVKNTLIKYLG